MHYFVRRQFLSPSGVSLSLSIVLGLLTQSTFRPAAAHELHNDDPNHTPHYDYSIKPPMEVVIGDDAEGEEYGQLL